MIDSKAVKILCILILISGELISQEADTVQKTNNYRTGVFLFGGIGPAIPVGDFGDNRETGFDLNTALSYRFPKKFLIRGMFDFSSFGFSTGAIQQQIGDEVYDLGGSNNLISLLVSGGYYFPIGNRVTPYVFAGGGVSFLSKPYIELDEVNNVVDIQQMVGTYFSNVIGGGIDFAINPPGTSTSDGKDGKTIYIFYLEAFYTRIPKITEVSDNRFGLLSINIGIKTTF